jgi:hypothetical protein
MYSYCSNPALIHAPIAKPKVEVLKVDLAPDLLAD